MSILIIAEHDHKTLRPLMRNTLTAASKLGPEIHLLIAGEGCDKVVSQARKIQGITKVLVAEDPALAHGLAEPLTDVSVSLGKNYPYILAPSTTFGKNLLPRVAALLDVGQISDVQAIEGPDTFLRPIYAGNVLARIQSLDPIKVMTIRTTAFEPAADAASEAPVEKLKVTLTSQHLSSFVQLEESKSERPELTSARIVVSGGRGLQSKENFKLIEDLADLLKGAVGASRAAVDAGYVSNDCQVGQTGKIVAPELYFAIGISGAIQHLAGMKESKIIVAINKDEEAPIFQVADYGIVGDLFQIVPELSQALRESQAKAS